MIKSTFQMAGDYIETVIDRNNLFFSIDGQITTIEGLRLDKSGVLKEFPDLKDNSDWRKIAIERLKEHLKSFNTEKEKNNYVIKELTKYGYEALFLQRAGFRPEKIR